MIFYPTPFNYFLTKLKYDVNQVLENLMPIAFLIGRWRSEFSGKAFFPTIPKFTYGEELNFSAHGYFSANGFLRYMLVYSGKSLFHLMINMS